jgi:hypothetical protein
MTVPAVSDVLALQARHRSTTDDRVANRYGSPTTPHFGHENPSGQRMDSRYRAQAASSGNTRWNSGREVGKPRMSIIATMADRYDLVKQTDKQGRTFYATSTVSPKCASVIAARTGWCAPTPHRPSPRSFVQLTSPCRRAPERPVPRRLPTPSPPQNAAAAPSVVPRRLEFR